MHNLEPPVAQKAESRAALQEDTARDDADGARGEGVWKPLRKEREVAQLRHKKETFEGLRAARRVF